MATLVVGLGALLVLGNLLLAGRVRAETSSVLRANADSQVSAISNAASAASLAPAVTNAQYSGVASLSLHAGLPI